MSNGKSWARCENPMAWRSAVRASASDRKIRAQCGNPVAALGRPGNDQIVLALVGFDKKSIGDVFYASAAARGEAIVDAWLRQKGTSHD